VHGKGLCCGLYAVVGALCGVLKGRVLGWSPSKYRKQGTTAEMVFRSLGSLVWGGFFLVGSGLPCFFCSFIPTSFIKSYMFMN